VLLHDEGGIVTEVESVWLAIGHPGFTHHQDVVAESERIWVVGDRSKVNIGVVTRSLSGGGTIEVPFREVLDGAWFRREGLQGDSQLSDLEA
jgi:hypothetical protein